jgi:hypothetical protein
MSWWTSVDFSYCEPDDSYNPRELELARERMQRAIAPLVESRGYHPDTATTLRELFACRQFEHTHQDFKLHSFALIDLFSKLAQQFPEVSFTVRGRGEDMRDIWVREYVGGKVTYEAGPPEEAVL